jgi:hypothetical protein
MPRFLPRLRARGRRPLAASRRLRLQELENRTTPAGLDFVPFSTAAINPSPVPPTALIQFNPLPDLSGIPAAGTTFQKPVHLLGSFQQTLTPVSSAANPVAPPPLKLQVTYSLNGSESGAAIPPGPTSTTPGTFNVQYNLTGTITETLTIPGISNTQPPTIWIITTKLSEQGTVAGPLNPATTNTPPVDVMNFSSTIGLNQVQFQIPATANHPTLWDVQSTIQSTGKFQVSPGVNSTAAAVTPFSLQNQLTESLAQISATGTPPSAPIKVTAVDNATGTVTAPLPLLSNTSPFNSFAGTTRYGQQLTETITVPPSPTQPGYTVTVTQAFDTNGLFQSFNVVPPSFVGGDLSTGFGASSGSGPGMGILA